MRTPCPDQQPSGAYVPWRPRRINTARNFLAGSSGVDQGHCRSGDSDAHLVLREGHELPWLLTF